MESGRSVNPVNVKDCKIPSLSLCPVIYPTYTSFGLKSLKNTVNFQSQEKWPCKNTWYRDVKSTHTRNWRLLDLPRKKPKCCSDIYNVVLDRQKLKNLQKFGLTREVRTITSGLETEEIKKCEPIEEIEAKKITYFPECYEIPESSSDEEDDEYEFCTSGSVSECSGCSTLGGGMRRKMHKVLCNIQVLNFVNPWRKLIRTSRLQNVYHFEELEGIESIIRLTPLIQKLLYWVLVIDFWNILEALKLISIVLEFFYHLKTLDVTMNFDY